MSGLHEQIVEGHQAAAPALLPVGIGSALHEVEDDPVAVGVPLTQRCRGFTVGLGKDRERRLDRADRVAVGAPALVRRLQAVVDDYLEGIEEHEEKTRWNINPLSLIPLIRPSKVSREAVVMY